MEELSVRSVKKAYFPDIEAMRDVLRAKQSVSLDRRRKIMAMSAVGMIDFTVISLYQTGVIKKLPDLPFKVFDSDSVNASKKAYAAGLPDGTTGAMMYALTMMLASFGGSKQTGRNKLFDKLLFGAVALSSAAGLQYLYDMTFKQKKICVYCVTGAFLNIGMLPLSWSELKENS